MRVRRGHVKVVPVQRKIPRGDDAARLRGVDLVLELPDQIAGHRIQRVDHAEWTDEIHGAVVHERVRLRPAGRGQRPRPRELQLMDVRPVDLIERAVPPRVARASPVDPVGRVWILEHRLRHLDELARLGRQPDTEQHQQSAQAGDGWNPHAHLER